MTAPLTRVARRVIVGVVYPLALGAALVVPYLWWRNELPAPIAVHFDVGGDADGSLPVAVHLLMFGAFTVGAAGLLAWAGWRETSRVGPAVAIAAFIGWLLGALNIILLAANAGQDRWQEVTLGPGPIWGAAFGALVAAVPVALLLRHGPNTAAAHSTPRIDFATTERAAWFGHTSSRTLAALGVVLIAAGTFAVLASPSAAALTGLVLLATGLALAAFMTVDVAVGEAGLTVRTPLRWPRLSIQLAEIEAARVVDWQPMRGPVVTGWGYRGSLRLMRRAGWVLRGGPAVHLDLTDGRQFIVTVDNADEAVSVLNGLLARAGTSAAG